MMIQRFRGRPKVFTISCFRIRPDSSFIIISSSNPNQPFFSFFSFIDRIKSMFSLVTLRHSPHPNPFFFISCSTFHTSKQPKINLSDLKYAFDCIQNIDEAVALFQYMLQMKPSPEVSDYCRLFKVVVKMEYYSQVILMFKKLCDLGCQVNEYTMSIVINCYAHLKEVDLGFAVVAHFLKIGFHCNIVSFNCLIKGLFLRGDVDKAVYLFKKVLRGKLAKFNDFTIPIVLHGLSNSGNVGDAVELLRISEKKEWKVNVVGYSAVIDGLCKARMLKDGMDLFVRMVERDIVPDVVTYTCLIHGLCKHGKLEFARGFFNELPKGVRPNVITYTVMIQGFCRNRLFRDAKGILEKMELGDCSPNAVTYNVIIQACLHNLDSLDSINLLKQIVGRNFQLDAPSFFLLLRRIQGIQHADVIKLLVEKLMSSYAIHRMRNNNVECTTNGLIHKLKS